MNAKYEFLKATAGRDVKCCYINDDILGYEDDSDKKSHGYILKIGWNTDEYVDFLAKLDFEYDAGYGSQRLHGIIWLDDGSWIERWEYDGSEGWVHKICPDIPEQLIS